MSKKCDKKHDKKCDKKCDNCASGKCSRADGFQTSAIGDYSSTDGYKTKACGVASHAQNNHSKAEGNSSTAIGCHTVAIGNCSLAEGSNTKSKGYASHAEGECTIAHGSGSHSEGVGGEKYHCILECILDKEQACKKIASDKRCEPTYNEAHGKGSHTEGGATFAKGRYSHAEGVGTQAIGDASHAQGLGSKAIGIASHAEGDPTIAEGYASHAEGVNTYAKGDGSHSEGFANDGHIHALGEGSHAEGFAQFGTILSARDGSHAEGSVDKGLIQAINKGAHAEGFVNGANQNNCNSNCYRNTNDNCHNFFVNPNYPDPNQIQAQSNAMVEPQIVVQEDFVNNGINMNRNNTVGTTPYNNRTNVSFQGQSVTNFQNSLNNNNFSQVNFQNGCIQNDCNLSKNCPSEESQITASGKGAHAEGYANHGRILAVGNGSHAQGLANLGTILASGAGSSAAGINNIATGLASHAAGIQALATQRGQYSHSSGAFTAVGDNQTSLYNLKIQNPSTTARPVYTFTLDGSGIINSYSIPIVPDNTSWTFHALIVGRDNGSNVHSEIKNACVSRASGNSTLIVVDDVPDIINIFGNPASFTQLNVDKTNGGIVLQVTPGLLNGTYPAMRWHATLWVSSVTMPSVGQTVCTVPTFLEGENC